MMRILSALAFGAAMAAGSNAFALDTETYQRIYTEFRGASLPLDVVNGGPKNNMTVLTAAADVSGQYWRLTPAGGGSYRLSTMFRGASMCLDIYNGGPRNNQPHLTDCADYSGQLWRLTPDRGWYRLTTEFRGEAMCLDVFNGGPNNNQPHLTACADFSGQYWRFESTGRSAW